MKKLFHKYLLALLFFGFFNLSINLIYANIASLTQNQLSFAPLVKVVSPAVVNIYATKIGEFSSGYKDPFFKNFFSEFFPFGIPHSRVQSSLGSGVIVRSDGVVITNDQVIKQVQDLKIVLSDGREFSADIIIKDPRTDLVALKIKSSKTDFPYLELRDADELQVGDIVLAVGNPFGIGQTVSMGIISGLARTEIGARDLQSFIQTDASINPGNSGGPLVTLDGRIVGINSAVFSNTSSSIGVNFAIPSNLVIPILSAMDQGGKIIRPWAGLSLQNLNKDIATNLGLKSSKGVIITKIFKGAAGDRGNLKQGDVIIKIDDHDINNEATYRFRIATARPGQKMEFTIWRDHQELKTQIEVESPPDLPHNEAVEIPGRNPLAGAIVMSLSPAVASDLGVSYDDQGGVIIVQLNPDTLALLAGFMPGDVILKINNVPIVLVDQLLRNLTRSQQGWEITFRRANEILVQRW